MFTTKSTAARDSISFVTLMLLGAVGLYFGWKTFWFLTDDAFIEYRYVSNSLLGHGYVWNAPPFLPVEGYTSFLWVAFLDSVWRVTGVDPPRSANLISLGFSFGSILLAALMVVRIPWTPRLRRFRMAFVALLLIGALSNRTFLAWTSSGLETAMFGFFVTLWVFVAATVSSPRRRLVLVSSVAALLALTRPDGLLFVAVTGALAIAQARLEPSRREAARSLLVGVSPWVVVIIHELWRLSFYGAWLPNTYYAKVVEPWPASGVRYATSYVVEYALWFPVLAAIALAVRRGIPRPSRATFGSLIASRAVPFVVTVAVAIHLLYYTLIVGGDHFEYRVYSYTIPLLFVGIAYVFNRAQCRPWTALALMSTFILLSAPVPWTHWAKTRHLTTRGETQFMFVPIASSWPKPVAWYARIFDRSQSWLIRHAVCMRHQEHKVFWRTQANGHPTRAEGAKIPGDGFPVFASYTVGVPSWVFPNVNVIDMFGLNDYVIARAPYPKDKQRFMAHGRKAPEGYVESYRPNVTERGWVAPRRGAISATGIACLEDYWRACLPQIRRGVGTFDYANACPP